MEHSLKKPILPWMRPMLLVLFAVIFGAFRQAARKEDDHADRG